MVLVIHFALQKFAPTFSIILNVLIYVGAVRTLWGNKEMPGNRCPLSTLGVSFLPSMFSSRQCSPGTPARAAARLAFSCLTLGSGETYSEAHFLWRKLAGDALSIGERGEQAKEMSWAAVATKAPATGSSGAGVVFQRFPK